ncbi:MAG: hypothetical protein QOD75_2602 [Blastocatellia bacterium]|jgi:hypothetical protein|nr:hypothetical protein [Blastocatellia bacterium]
MLEAISNPSSLLGPQASRPPTRRQARGFQFETVSTPNALSRYALIAGGTPAVPVKSWNNF